MYSTGRLGRRRGFQFMNAMDSGEHMSMVQVEHPKALILEPRASGGWKAGPGCTARGRRRPGTGRPGGGGGTAQRVGRTGVLQCPSNPARPFCRADTWVVVDGEEVPHELTLAEVHPSLCSVYIPPSGARKRGTEDLV